MSTLVIAFDGLDYELIKEFDLEHIPQKEFGKIDNHTRVTQIVTSELFASFITGKTHEVHGVRSLVKWSNPRIEMFEKKVEGSRFFDKFRQLREAIFESINELNAQKRKYRREDLHCETIFEKLEESRAMFVPAYNPSIFWVLRADLEPIKYGYSLEETADHLDTRDYRYRKETLFSQLENEFVEPRDFLMCHFHRPDTYQHLFGDEHIGILDKERLRPMYEEMDQLAEQIRKKAEEKGYDRIIFMSDHGLPAKGAGHNKNAFYSCNKELFGDEEPHITDFYNEIIKGEKNGE